VVRGHLSSLLRKSRTQQQTENGGFRQISKTFLLIGICPSFKMLSGICRYDYSSPHLNLKSPKLVVCVAESAPGVQFILFCRI